MTINKVYFEIDDADLPHILNIKAFGAKCDGVTDDSAAIKACILHHNGLLDKRPQADTTAAELSALREELAEKQALSEVFYQKQRNAEIKLSNAEKRLTAAEQRNADLVELLREAVEDDAEGPHYFGPDMWGRIQAAIHQSESGSSE